MSKSRRLTDLYIIGKSYTFNDNSNGDGGVEVYIRKLNPIDNETALRKANASRARFLTIRKDPNSELFLSIVSQVSDIGDRDELIGYVIAPESAKISAAREAELESEDEWSKDDYLQGLKDAWAERLSLVYAEDPNDPEASRVFKEFGRFNAELEKRIGSEIENLKSQYADTDIERLRDKVIDQMIDLQADMSWLNEYRKCEIWLSVRDPLKRNDRYFNHRDEVDELSQEMLVKLMDAYREISVDVTEGKDSAVTEDSSPQPEPQNSPGTEASSGHLTVIQ